MHCSMSYDLPTKPKPHDTRRAHGNTDPDRQDSSEPFFLVARRHAEASDRYRLRILSIDHRHSSIPPNTGRWWGLVESISSWLDSNAGEGPRAGPSSRA